MSSLYLTDLSPSSLFPPSSLHPLSVLSPSSLRPPSSDFPLVPPPSSFIPPPPVLLSSSSFFRRDPARGGECKEGNQGGGQEGRSGISQASSQGAGAIPEGHQSHARAEGSNELHFASPGGEHRHGEGGGAHGEEHGGDETRQRVDQSAAGCWHDARIIQRNDEGWIDQRDAGRGSG
ncbi:unnamed protein product [Closterium sp. NIES-54]